MAFSIVLYDDFEKRNHLLPLVATRPIADLRVGLKTLAHKWGMLTNLDVSYLTVSYLRDKFPLSPIHSTVVVINGGVIPSRDLFLHIQNLPLYSYLVDSKGNWIAVKIGKEDMYSFCTFEYEKYARVLYDDIVELISVPEDIFIYNAEQIKFDIELNSVGVAEVEMWSEVKFYGTEAYIDEGARIDYAVLDTRTGPIYIGRNVVIENGVTIKGPAAICEGARLKSGAILYPNVTIGPNCTVSGELNNTVMWGNSAKGHDGYLGYAVVGEGCNLGAGTTNSNLKNDWSTVRLYDYESGDFRDTGLLKCGVIIGDQVMLGIHSKINTGTVIGVGAQIAISKFIPKFVQDFSWLTEDKEEKYIFARFMSMLMRKAAAKKEVLDQKDEAVYQYIYENFS